MESRRPAPVADSSRTHHRLRQPAQAGHLGGARQSARRRRGQADQGILRMIRPSRRSSSPTTRWRISANASSVAQEMESAWSTKFDDLRQKKSRRWPANFRSVLAKELPNGWDAELPVFTPKDSLATRVSASQAEAAIAKKVWSLFGGSADLNESTFTDIKDGGDFERGQLRRPQSPLRHPRARHVLDSQRHRAARRLHPVRLELPVLHRLRARRRSGSRR